MLVGDNFLNSMSFIFKTLRCETEMSSFFWMHVGISLSFFLVYCKHEAEISCDMDGLYAL